MLAWLTPSLLLLLLLALLLPVCPYQGGKR
jgi:hypothetical protein